MFHRPGAFTVRIGIGLMCCTTAFALAPQDPSRSPVEETAPPAPGQSGESPAPDGASGVQNAVEAGDAARGAENSHDDEGTSKQPKPANALAIQALESKVEELSWENQSFESIIAWLRERGEISVIPVWRALEDIGVRRTDGVTLQMRDTTVHAVLVEVCDQLSLYGEVGFIGYGNVIKISSQKHLDRKVYVRVYDVRDLIFEVGEFASPDAVAGAKLGASVEMDNYRTPEERMADLANVLRRTIDPDRWAENGGDCALVIHETSLVVRAPISVHQKLTGAFYLP